MKFYPVKEGGRMADPIRSAKNKSGVYVIREMGIAGNVLYVGESHSGRLYGTITRHFQHWKGETAGPTYNPERCTIAVEITPAEKAIQTQDDAIQFYWPRDNKDKNPRTL